MHQGEVVTDLPESSRPERRRRRLAGERVRRRDEHPAPLLAGTRWGRRAVGGQTRTSASDRRPAEVAGFFLLIVGALLVVLHPSPAGRDARVQSAIAASPCGVLRALSGDFVSLFNGRALALGSASAATLLMLLRLLGLDGRAMPRRGFAGVSQGAAARRRAQSKGICWPSLYPNRPAQGAQPPNDLRLAGEV